MLLPAQLYGQLNGMAAAGQRLPGLAEADLALQQQIAASPAFVDDGRTRGESLLRREHRRQRLAVDPDGRQRRRQRLLRLRHRQGHRVAAVADNAISQDRLILLEYPQAVFPANVFVGQHRHHARQRAG